MTDILYSVSMCAIWIIGIAWTIFKVPKWVRYLSVLLLLVPTGDQLSVLSWYVPKRIGDLTNHALRLVVIALTILFFIRVWRDISTEGERAD